MVTLTSVPTVTAQTRTGDACDEANHFICSAGYSVNHTVEREKIFEQIYIGVSVDT